MVRREEVEITEARWALRRSPNDDAIMVLLDEE
jgi:hypothetical protein